MSAPKAGVQYPEAVVANEDLPAMGARSSRLRVQIIAGIIALLVAIGLLYLRAVLRTNHVALSARAKPVTVQKTRAGTFRAQRTYVGTIEAWNAAKIGPQFVSAYVNTVLVRPGAVVKRGEVLATLDCRNASAASKEIAAKANALQERQAAIAHETERTKQLIAGGFASENEVEQLQAKTASEQAEVESLRASLTARALDVSDCVLRAPFDSEVADRYVDPGAYVRPSNPVITVIDRSTVRVVADAPESDFNVVATGTPVTLTVEASGQKLTAKVSRRAPAADDSTRTVHFEIDVPNKDHSLPVGATAQLAIEVGEPQPATLIPLQAATIRGDKATVFTADKGVAKRVVVPILGEQGGTLFVDSKLGGGTPVVVEGRSLLEDDDRVEAKEIAQ